MNSIKSIKLADKTELLGRLSVYALSKIHLDKYESFRKILLILSWDMNLNTEPVHGIQNENLLQVLLYFLFYYNPISLSENESRNEWNVFKKREIYFICININSLLQKIDEVRYIANITKASVIGINVIKLDKIILLIESEVDKYDLVRLNRSRRGGGVACCI